MSPKHLAIRIQQCLALSQASNCPRRKFGALLLDPKRNVILMDGYNGGPRGGGKLCGGDVCLRDTLQIPSGNRVEIGCHHSEMNVICNAAASGVPCAGAWMIVTGEPCMMCAKLIHHAGIERVYVVGGGYAGGKAGVEYLRGVGVEVEEVAGPQDPRTVQPHRLKEAVDRACRELETGADIAVQEGLIEEEDAETTRGISQELRAAYSESKA